MGEGAREEEVVASTETLAQRAESSVVVFMVGYVCVFCLSVQKRQRWCCMY